MYQVYGIKNCNTVKKGLDWLDHNQIEYEFLDVKKNVLDKNLLNTWMKNLQANLRWEQLINKAGITWRQLSEEDKLSAENTQGAIQLILKKPSVMKRPVITENNQVISIGYDDTHFKENFL
jgi:arsenate reductase